MRRARRIAHVNPIPRTRPPDEGRLQAELAAERDLSWFDSSGFADVSEDGSQILFDDRFGVYVRRTDGSPPVRLGLQED